MNIRKHWKYLLFSSTAFFWAGCGGDSESSTAPQVPESSAAVSSSEMAEPASSDAAPSSSEIGSNTESSCDAMPSSSSDAVQSSSSDGTMAFKLASDPNVTCKMTGTLPTGSCIEFAKTTSTRSFRPSQQNLKGQLEDSPDFEEAPLYGVQMPSCRRYNFQETFECSNGSTYTTFADSSGTHVLKDSTIYSREEYNQKFRAGNP